MIQTKKPDWGKRIARASELTQQYPGTAEVLTFYRHILEFQQALYDGVASRPAAGGDGPFRQRLDVDTAMQHLPALLSLVQRSGPSKLAQEAAEIGRSSAEEQRQTLRDFLANTDAVDAGAHSFFARVLFQPLAEHLAAAPAPGWPDSPARYARYVTGSRRSRCCIRKAMAESGSSSARSA